MKRMLLATLILLSLATVASADEPDLMGADICCYVTIPACICAPVYAMPPCPIGLLYVDATTTHPAFCAAVLP